MCELSVGDEVLQMNGMTVGKLSQVVKILLKELHGYLGSNN